MSAKRTSNKTKIENSFTFFCEKPVWKPVKSTRAQPVSEPVFNQKRKKQYYVILFLSKKKYISKDMKAINYKMKN